MTYNVHGYVSNFDLNPIVDVIKTVSPDILVLQEAVAGSYNQTIMTPMDVLSVEMGMNIFTLNNSYLTSTPGIAILSVFPITILDVVELSSLETFTKYLLVSKIETDQGSVVVAGTHLEVPYQPSIQLDQVNEIKKIADRYSDMLFLCDCNSPDTIFHPAYNVLARYFEDAWIADGHSVFGGNTWDTQNPRLRVDYIWFKGAINIVEDSVRRVGGQASDHFAVVAEIFL